MSKMNIYKQQKILLLRYSDNIHKNTIDAHKQVLNYNGYVWYGKIGAIPSIKTLSSIENNGEYYMILHSSKSGSYICSFNEINSKTPETGFPEYYYELLEKNGYFKLFFKITKMVKLPSDFHQHFSLASSNENITNALNYSMGSMFVAKADSDLVY